MWKKLFIYSCAHQKIKTGKESNKSRKHMAQAWDYNYLKPLNHKIYKTKTGRLSFKRLLVALFPLHFLPLSQISCFTIVM